MLTPSSDLFINSNEERIMDCIQFLGQNLVIPIKIQFQIRDNSLWTLISELAATRKDNDRLKREQEVGSSKTK